MSRLLQINVTANWGSTGKIAEQIGHIAKDNGWDSYIAYGRMSNPSESELLKIGNTFDVYCHYAESRIFDREGLASRGATKKLIQQINDIRPDVIHLHNIHDHYLNYPILLSYISKKRIPVVWTFHDCWAFTGHCTYFQEMNCEKWKTGCNHCPQSLGLIDKSERNYLLKKQITDRLHGLVIVPVSEWLASYVRSSFFKNREITVVDNGIDTDIFKPTPIAPAQFSSIPEGRFVILAMANGWDFGGRKGLDDYIEMSKMLSDDECIVLVGMSSDMIKKMPSNIVGINKVNDQKLLAHLYTKADVVTSLSSAETFGMTVIEANACGTPVVVYDNSAPPYLVTEQTGLIARNKDVADAYNKIQIIKKRGKSYYSEPCVKYAREKYDKRVCFKKYLDIYESLLVTAG